MRNRTPGNGLWKGFMLLCIGCILIAVGLSLGGHWTGVHWWPWQNGSHSFNFDWDSHDNGGDTDSMWDESDGDIIQDIVDQGDAIPLTVRNIDVQIKAASIVLKTEGENTRWFATDFVRDALVVHVDGDTLHVEERDWRHSLEHGDNLLKPRLEIVLPEGVALGSCNLSIGAGSVTMSPITVDSLKMESGAGSIKGSGIVARSASLESGVGEIALTACDFGETRIQTGAGRIAYEGSLGDRTEIDTGAGTIEMKLSGTEDDYRIEYSRGIGSIRIGGQSFTGVGDGTGGNRNANKRIKLSSGIGAVQIDFAAAGTAW